MLDVVLDILSAAVDGFSWAGRREDSSSPFYPIAVLLSVAGGALLVLWLVFG